VSTLRIGGLCSGYGGLEMAVQDVLGGEIAWVADTDPGAARILAHHHPDVPNLGDITTTDWTSVEPVDVLAAGTPCQDISYAGRGVGITKESRSGVFFALVEAARVLRPRLIVLENVAGIVARRPGLDVVLADLARIGFDAEWVCVRASDVGAPHQRRRWFLIAWPAGDLPDLDVLPAPRAGTPVPGGVTLLPTPLVADSTDTANFRPDGTPYGAGYGQTLTDAVRLLPTPTVSDANGIGEHGTGGLDLRTAISLLPTPRARDSKGLGYPDQLPNVIEALLPTPRASDTGTPGRRASEGWRPPLSQVVLPLTAWGVYEPAIRRWEPIIGRRVPDPTEPTGQDGRHQLAPRFVEWMMGVADGHVTAPEIGLTRAEQLRALGNGVVPLQGSYATRLLLSRLAAERPRTMTA
jgi:DNA (cytosine-5)-methyltransferase 1